jgi:hypothetical protein
MRLNGITLATSIGFAVTARSNDQLSMEFFRYDGKQWRPIAGTPAI